MDYSYSINSELENIQKILLQNSIKQFTNTELLNSEEAVKKVYDAYADKIKNVGSKIYDFNNFLVKSKQVITKEYFDYLLQDIYNDLHALYINMKYIDDILNINLQKNKKFYGTIEKRILALEQKLDIARLNVNNTIGFDKIYFEGFDNKSSDSYYYNLIIDKKSGELSLKPIDIHVYNKKYNIRQVTSTLYPVANNDGGVLVTTNNLNTYEENYRRDGLNDMLINGLWKEQVFCNEVPDIQFYINKNVVDAPTFKIVTQGIVSYVDIEFKYFINFNNIEIDLFGEYETNVLLMLYKKEENDSWLPVSKLKRDIVDDQEIVFDTYTSKAQFNIIQFKNLEMMHAKYLRIIFNQKNYSLIHSDSSQVADLTKKIYTDLSERRLDVLKLDGNSDSKPAIPRLYHYDSFYNELYEIIEYSSSVNEMIKKLITKLNPTPKLITIEFNKLLKYELGAWSIEPKLLQYIGTGIYISRLYEYNDRPLVSITLDTKQEDIKSNSCNWYISDNLETSVIPIIPNDELIRKEPLLIVEHEYYKDLGWTDGTLIKLEFPCDLKFIDYLVLYEDEKFISPEYLDMYPLNSQLIFIKNIKDPKKHKYVIKYIPAKYNSTNVYVLFKTKKYNDNVLEYQIVASRKSILELFLDKTNLTEDYTIKKVPCTEYEYHSYFDDDYANICITKKYYNKEPYKSVIDTYLYPNIVEKLRDVNINYTNSAFILDEPPATPLVLTRKL